MDKISLRLDKKVNNTLTLPYTGILKHIISGDTELLYIYYSGDIQLLTGTTISISRKYHDDVYDIDYNFQDSFEVKDINYAEKYIVIDYPRRDLLILKDVIVPESGTISILEFNEPHNIIQADVWKMDLLINGPDKDDPQFFSEKFYINFVNNGNMYAPFRNLSVYDEWAYSSWKNGLTVSDDSYNTYQLYCKNLPAEIGKLKNIACFANGSKYVYDKKFIGTNDGNAIYDSSFLDENIIISYEFNFRTIPIFLNSCTNNNLLSEEITRSYLIADIKESSIPKIIDLEKVCFEPMFEDADNKLHPVKEISINPHFRDRGKENGWNTNDDKFWYFWDGDEEKTPEVDKADPILSMNFTEDDIMYQKNKLKKSFLRLSFYDTNRPTTQQLLYYSTIFINTNDLFGRYSKIKKEISEMNLFSMMNDRVEDLKNSITCNFTVFDRYNNINSSEGFYLYSFPNIVSDNFEKYIYMKIEFNHAGVGKTIPFIWNNGELPPISFIEEIEEGVNEVNVDKFFDAIYIPIKIGYSAEHQKYSYVFPKETVDFENDKVILNIFEPKMN